MLVQEQADLTSTIKYTAQNSVRYLVASYVPYTCDYSWSQTLETLRRRDGVANGNDDARKQWSDWLNEEK